MHLNRWNTDRFESIGYCYACVGVCGGIENDAVDFIKIRLLYGVNKRALVV